MRRVSLIFTLCIGLQFSYGQDVHFTMFHVAPTVLNPAAAGVFDGTFRASTNFKTQWGSISNPYNTFSATVDGNLWKDYGGKAHMGAALSGYRDVAGSSKMGTTKINLSLSGIVYLDNYNTLSTGLTAGWAQRSISPDGLMWDSQFQGLAYDPTLPSNESFSYDNSDFFDFGAGVMWAYGTSASNLASFDKFKAQVGLAYHHLSRPKMDTYYGATEKLYGKFALHGNLNFAQKYSKLAFQPRFTAFKQGPSFEVNLGMMFRYLISEGSKYTGNIQGLAIAMGGYYRVGDAFSPSVELEIAGFTIGYAYDFNMSDLRVASNGFGGSEFYLKFQNPNPFFRFSRRPSIR